MTINQVFWFSHVYRVQDASRSFNACLL
jgi:hypothetical protein